MANERPAFDVTSFVLIGSWFFGEDSLVGSSWQIGKSGSAAVNGDRRFETMLDF